MDREGLQRLASKLGMTAPSGIRKAEEYLRLSQVKCAPLLAQVTATSRAVICLDLAAAFTKNPVDKNYLVTLSGLNKTTYQSCLRSFESLLGVHPNLGIQELAVQFCCLEAVNMASKILKRYLKLKVDKNKMVAASGVKRAIFDRLHGQLEKISQQISRESEQLVVEAAKIQKTFLDCLGKEEDVETEEVVPHKRPKRETEATEEYEEWKRRILENAAKSQESV